ncbi:MAG TPA: ATP-grasp domain-containing protein, partial [Candidatus Brocadiia bacterium]|nr:ATP-grasp domain-containing protein [Candidatus Brocadiia bacterium]
MPNSRVLVVSTTPDYIQAILCRYPGRAVFITDRRVRAHAAEPRPPAEDELLGDLGDPATVLASLREHLRRHGQEPAGVACFDCESLALASFVGSALGLHFPSAEAVTACRSKLECKRRWRRAGVACPRAGHVSNETEARAFLEKLAAPAVLKPLTGSGSELTFQCDGPDGLASAFRVIHDRLAHHGDGRMYATRRARHVFAMEEFIPGDEYSADFIVEDGQVRIIRVAAKLPAKDQTFGVTRAYIV